MRDNIKGVFDSRSTLLLDVHKMIEILNPKIIGKLCARKPHEQFDVGESGKNIKFPTDLLYKYNH